MRSFFRAVLIILALLPGRMITAQVAAVKFTVIVPEFSNQKNATVYLTGSFNGWSPHDSLYIMNKETENSYSLTVPLFEGKIIIINTLWGTGIR